MRLRKWFKSDLSLAGGLVDLRVPGEHHPEESAGGSWQFLRLPGRWWAWALTLLALALCAGAIAGAFLAPRPNRTRAMQFGEYAEHRLSRSPAQGNHFEHMDLDSAAGHLRDQADDLEQRPPSPGRAEQVWRTPPGAHRELNYLAPSVAVQELYYPAPSAAPQEPNYLVPDWPPVDGLSKEGTRERSREKSQERLLEFDFDRPGSLQPHVPDDWLPLEPPNSGAPQWPSPTQFELERAVDSPSGLKVYDNTILSKALQMQQVLCDAGAQAVQQMQMQALHNWQLSAAPVDQAPSPVLPGGQQLSSLYATTPLQGGAGQLLGSSPSQQQQYIAGSLGQQKFMGTSPGQHKLRGRSPSHQLWGSSPGLQQFVGGSIGQQLFVGSPDQQRAMGSSPNQQSGPYNGQLQSGSQSYPPLGQTVTVPIMPHSYPRGNNCQ